MDEGFDVRTLSEGHNEKRKMRTIRKNSMLGCALLGVMVAGQAMATDIRYHGNGDYFDLESTSPGGNGWQSTAVPGALDTARFNWANNTVTLAGAAPTISRFQMGVDESGGLVVNSGGSLTTTSSGTIGNNNGGATPVNGFLTINSGGVVNNGGSQLRLGGGAVSVLGNLTGTITLNGGILNDSGHLWVGAANNTIGTININTGGLLNMLGVGGNGMLGLGTVNSTSTSGGFGFLNVNDGGVLNLFNIQATGLGSIQPGSLLDISGTGLVTIPGDFVSVMNDYIGAGRITGNDVPGNVQAIFDADLNKTFLTVLAVPEPSTFALMAFAGLTLAFRQRRKN
jgi:hypothetical protein